MQGSKWQEVHVAISTGFGLLPNHGMSRIHIYAALTLI